MFAPTHVEKVIRHLVRFGATHVEAEDLAQESLLIAWKKQGQLDQERSLDGWLFGIARNVYRNHARSARRSPFADAPGSETSGSGPAAASSITSSMAVRAAVQTLPENQQDIVILHELEEYTLKETAKLLSIPFDTAKDRLRRARDTLRTTMGDDFAIAGAAERQDARTASKVAVAGVLAGFLGLLARSGTAAAATGGAIVAGQGAASAGSVWTAKLAIAAALVGGIGVGVVAERARATTPPRTSAQHGATAASPSVPAVVAPVVPAPAVPGVVVPVVPDVVVPPAAAAAAVSRPGARADRPPAPGSAAGGPGVDAEAQLIERARNAVARGRNDEALRTLMSHERQFPAGQLAEERDVLLIDAYVSAKNHRIARDRIERFGTEYPASIHRAKVAALAQELEQ